MDIQMTEIDTPGKKIQDLAGHNKNRHNDQNYKKGGGSKVC